MKLKIWTSLSGWNSWAWEGDTITIDNEVHLCFGGEVPDGRKHFTNQSEVDFSGPHGFIMFVLQYHGGNCWPKPCEEMPELLNLNQIVVGTDTGIRNSSPGRIITGRFFEHPLSALKSGKNVNLESITCNPVDWIIIVDGE